MISRLTKISHLIGWDPWIKKKGNYLSCLEEKGGAYDIHWIDRMSHFLLIYYKISFVITYIR